MVFTLYGCGSHVTNIILTHFHFLVPKSLHPKFNQKGQVISEKNKI